MECDTINLEEGDILLFEIPWGDEPVLFEEYLHLDITRRHV